MPLRKSSRLIFSVVFAAFTPKQAHYPAYASSTGIRFIWIERIINDLFDTKLLYGFQK